ncbi:hypothetical protein BEN48_06610 [Hymenobacter glacialis]|uniref:DUF1648 domain-containing protein n=2 Tax=Hymenobacter glacialis TaxID=1908236 RepID=A0A1G1SRR8_9BACT|nr:hypothetical protein BEN48_06610 [Hymenobacter glacialis]
METRPKIIIAPTPGDSQRELLAWGLLAFLWALATWSYFQIPDTVPVHYNFAGQPDRYGEKAGVLHLPMVATVLFVAMTALGRFPHVLNYPSAITAANAPGKYRSAVRLLQGLKTVIVLVFLFLVFRTYQTATEQASGLGGWFLPVALGFVLLLVLWYLVRDKSAS